MYRSTDNKQCVSITSQTHQSLLKNTNIKCYTAPDTHFDKLCLFSSANAERLEIRNSKIYKNYAKGWGQIRPRMELYMREVILHFEMNF
jgi:hypothetical protein